MPVEVYFEEVDPIIFSQDVLESGVFSLVQDYDFSLGDITVVLCSDAFLLDMNKRYLSHDYFTDIITFDYSESGHIAGDLFISVDTVKSNSDFFKVLFADELWRVLIHGVLHLCGLNDKSESDQVLMRNTEDVFLSRLDNPFVSRET